MQPSDKAALSIYEEDPGSSDEETISPEPHTPDIHTPGVSIGAYKRTSTPIEMGGKGKKNKNKGRISGGADYEAKLTAGELSPVEVRAYYLNLTNDPITDKVPLISKVYREMLAEGISLTSIQEWDSRLIAELNIIEVQNIRRLEVPRPFIDQVYHFLQLCGVDIRN